MRGLYSRLAVLCRRTLTIGSAKEVTLGELATRTSGRLPYGSRCAGVQGAPNVVVRALNTSIREPSAKSFGMTRLQPVRPLWPSSPVRPASTGTSCAGSAEMFGDLANRLA